MMPDNKTITTGRGSMEQLREQSQVVGHDIQELGKIAKTVASEKFEQGKNKAKEWEKSFEDTIRRNPIKSILIAAGIGLTVGYLVRRR